MSLIVTYKIVMVSGYALVFLGHMVKLFLM